MALPGPQQRQVCACPCIHLALGSALGSGSGTGEHTDLGFRHQPETVSWLSPQVSAEDLTQSLHLSNPPSPIQPRASAGTLAPPSRAPEPVRIWPFCSPPSPVPKFRAEEWTLHSCPAPTPSVGEEGDMSPRGRRHVEGHGWGSKEGPHSRVVLTRPSGCWGHEVAPWSQ